MFKSLLIFTFVLLPFPDNISDDEILQIATAKNKSSTEVSKVIDENSLNCLATNIYFESGNESSLGKLAVAQVVLNRVKNKQFPNTICDVVQQAQLSESGLPVKYKCAFSWYCDGKSDIPFKGKQWSISYTIAYTVMLHNQIPDVTNGATHYHAVYVSPWWTKHYKYTSTIGRHIFYK